MPRSGQLRSTDLMRTVRAAGIRDERLLGAIARVPRLEFVPAEAAAGAYFDEPIPIGHGQVTTQPSLVARMVEALGLRGGEQALEIGTGLGWQTALLATLAGRVWSIERFPDLAEAARSNLAARGIENAEVVVGDGSEGLAEHAPYDAIVVSAASPEVPSPLAEQIADGGRLVHPLGTGGDEQVMLFEKRSGELRARRTLTGARFVKLVSPES
jgi:protein-L-isoaspartate(D-aspartate) O-methyltransferase